MSTNGNSPQAAPAAEMAGTGVVGTEREVMKHMKKRHDQWKVQSATKSGFWTYMHVSATATGAGPGTTGSDLECITLDIAVCNGSSNNVLD
jgi:hypothetical protein